MKARLDRLVPSPLAFAASIAVGGLLAAPALADDANAGAPLPPLHAQPARSVQVDATAVRIDGRQVTVDMQARTIRPATSATITWRSVLVGWIGESEPYPDRQFPELQIDVDGAPALATQQTDVFVGKTDVSPLVAAARLDPWTITQTPPLLAKPADGAAEAETQARGELVQRGAITASPDGDLAAWSAQRRVEVLMAPAPVHPIHLAYTARPGYVLLTMAQLASPASVARWCLSPAAIKLLRSQPGSSDGVAVEEFAIPVGIDEMRPKHVTLASGLAPVAEAATPAVAAAPPASAASAPIEASTASVPASTPTATPVAAATASAPSPGDAAAPAAPPASDAGTVFVCGAHGHGMVTASELAATDVQVDAHGVLHVLRLAPAALVTR